MAHAVTCRGEANGLGRTDGNEPKHVTTTLAVENMHCGNCMRTVEAALTAMPGVKHARVNLSTGRVAIQTHTTAPPAERYISALAAKGFQSREIPEASGKSSGTIDDDYLRRLGVAGFAAANIMLLSVSVWSGHGGDMPASQQGLFHWLSALIAIPAVAYSGQPFFKSARSALAARRVNMDVPISLGVMLATAMSLYQTFRGSEQIYFDAAVTSLSS